MALLGGVLVGVGLLLTMAPYRVSGTAHRGSAASEIVGRCSQDEGEAVASGNSTSEGRARCERIAAARLLVGATSAVAGAVMIAGAFRWAGVRRGPGLARPRVVHLTTWHLQPALVRVFRTRPSRRLLRESRAGLRTESAPTEGLSTLRSATLTSIGTGLELMPVRRGLLISALVEILTHVGGFAVTVPFYHRRSVTLIVGLWVGWPWW